MTIRVHHYEQRDGLDVCKHCGVVRNRDAVGPRWCPGKTPPIETRDSDRLIEDLRAVLRRIVETWPRADQSMGPSYYFCPACGLRCSDGDKCLKPELRRLGVLDGGS